MLARLRITETGTVAALLLCTNPAWAEETIVLPTTATGAVQPLFVSPPDETEAAVARRAFADAARKQGLLPVETVEAPAPPASGAPAPLHDGIAATRKLDFDRALALLDQAAAEVETRGGAGLSSDELGDLYFHRAWARERADWKEAPSPVDEATRQRAAADYARAAMVQPARIINERDVPPRAIESWKKALAEVNARPRAALVINAPAGAVAALDGAKRVVAPITLGDVVQGPHLLRVEETGRVTWSTTVEVAAPRTEVNVPARDPMSLPATAAARSARRMGARWAVVAEPRLRDGRPALELRLVDTAGGVVSTSSAQVSGEPGALEAALLVLVNEARRLDLAGAGPVPTPVAAAAPLAPPPSAPGPAAASAPRATFGEDPGLWARQHWPLLTAVSVALGAALVLGLAVSADGSAK